MAGRKTYFVCRDGTQFGAAETVELTEAQAAAFIRAGDISEIEGAADRKRLKRARSAARPASKPAGKTEAARIKALEADLVAANAQIDERTREQSRLAIEVAETRQSLEEAAFEAESLKRVVERLREVGPEAVQQAEQAVAAELEAQAAEAESAAATGGGQ